MKVRVLLPSLAHFLGVEPGAVVDLPKTEKLERRIAAGHVAPAAKRGRPKGSKNKPKAETAEAREAAETADDE